MMEDKQIIELYWERNQEAISQTAEKYGNYCTAIARNILQNEEDAEEESGVEEMENSPESGEAETEEISSGEGENGG